MCACVSPRQNVKTLSDAYGRVTDTLTVWTDYGGCDCWAEHTAVVVTPLCTDEMTQPFGIFNILYLENENN